MKLPLAMSVIVFAALSAAPSFAANQTIGLNAAADCASAAQAQSRNLPVPSGRQDAIATCSMALDGMLSKSNRTATLANRGMLEAAANHSSAALADFNAALSRDPSLADVYVNRGAALLRAGHYGEARADFDHALNLKTSNAAVAYLDRGMAQEKSGDVAAAYRDYKQALQIAPDFEPAKVELARFHVASDRVASR